MKQENPLIYEIFNKRQEFNKKHVFTRASMVTMNPDKFLAIQKEVLFKNASSFRLNNETKCVDVTICGMEVNIVENAEEIEIS